MAILGAICLVACVTTQLAPPVDDTMVSLSVEAGHDADALERGRQIYLARCARCHSLEPIRRYSIAEWDEILPDMAHEAKLDAAQAQLVRNYVMVSYQYLGMTPSKPAE